MSTTASGSPVRVALFGLGGVAERIHLPALGSIAGVDLVAACDPSEERRNGLRHRLGTAEVYADARHLLERESPDLVIVGSPPDSHAELCRLALEAGAHVLCEKPFVSTLSEADAVLETARRTGRGVRVNNQYRYMPIYRETKRRIGLGDFGAPYFLQVWQQMFHPPQFESNWRASLRESTLYEFGTHALDLVCFFFGALPEAVSAVVPQTPHGIDSDVLVQLTLRFPGERLATLALNRVSRAPRRYLEMRLDCVEASLRISLGGVARVSIDWASERARPTLRASLVRGGESRVERNGRSRVLVRQRSPAFASATADLLRDLLAELREGRVSLEAAEQAREVLRVVFFGYESARTGDTIRITPTLRRAATPRS